MVDRIVKVRKLTPLAQVPEYKTKGAAGFDLAAAEKRVIFPGETVVVRTGLAMEIPPGLELQIRPRSGISLKTPLIMKNAPGTIDSDYRGEIGIILHNINDPDGPQGNRPYTVQVGDRIAQGVLAPVVSGILKEAEELSDTERGAGGYGSTGV